MKVLHRLMGSSTKPEASPRLIRNPDHNLPRNQNPKALEQQENAGSKSREVTLQSQTPLVLARWEANNTPYKTLNSRLRENGGSGFTNAAFELLHV